MSKMMISLESDEREALIKMSEKELRNPKMQIRLILRTEFERQGLLPMSNNNSTREENKKNL